MALTRTYSAYWLQQFLESFLLRHSRLRSLLMALAVSGLVAQALGGHERWFYAFQSAWYAPYWSAHGVWLPDYQVRLEARPLSGITGNLSGLAWDPDRQGFWAVVNNPELLVLLNPEGEVLARYPLSGFTDVEGVAYMGDGLLVVSEERSRSLVVIPAPTGSEGEIIHDRLLSMSLHMAGETGDNAGLEGLGYDPEGDRLFLVKQRAPMALYEVRGLKRSLGGALQVEVLDHQDWLDELDMIEDLSSVEFDPLTGHLLLVSARSQMLIELGRTGSLISYRHFGDGVAGLDQAFPQAEGVALDGDGNLFLVSEPNLFYSFRRN